MSMNQKHRKRYTAEFKTQAVELLETGRPVAEIAEKLCISTNLLYSWKNASRRAQIGSEGPRAAGEQDGADDLRVLRRENDILKKAAVILGTKPQPNSAP
jgi:transposase-like protein